MKTQFSVLIVCFLVFACMVYAQEESDTVIEKPDTSHLEDYESSLYPSFVSSDTNVPDYIEEELKEVEAQTELGEPGENFINIPEPSVPESIMEIDEFSPLNVLVGDPASTETWTLVRQRIDPTVENIQVLMLSRADEKEVKQEYRKLAGDLNALIEMASYQAPIQEEGLKYYRDRILKQQKYLIKDYINQDSQRFENTLPLLQLSLSRFNKLLFQSDLDRGASPPEVYEPPTDWDPHHFQTSHFSSTIKPWTTQSLLDGYKERYKTVVNSLDENREFRDSETIYEMGELARELATRIYDVPISSRLGFRNATLRLDVMSQNLLDYTREQNYPHSKRQLYAMKKGIKQVEAFLDQNKKGRK